MTTYPGKIAKYILTWGEISILIFLNNWKDPSFFYSLAPKPVFHVNGKSKSGGQKHRTHEVITPQHEELIKFVHDCEFKNFFFYF